jgi:ubiquinone/menaquinone biosynthesis C-methylase UbiE
MQSRRLEDFADCCAAFADSYAVSNLAGMREVERSVLGCDYGGTSWTTRDQARQIIDLLALDSDAHLLDIGAGSGWPGLLLATESGCEVTLLDLPVTALRLAGARARSDRISERVHLVAGSGGALPIATGAFERISHSDVLCCLPDKVDVLGECRRVAVAGASMLFSVIAVADGISAEDARRVTAAGPPFVDAPASYTEMLVQTGWKVLRRIDATEDHIDSLQKLVTACENSEALLDALGADGVEQTRAHRLEQLEIIRAGLMVREIYLVSAA